MTKREKILAIIRAGVAKTGDVSFHEIRLYVENRISSKSFKEAVRQGKVIYRSQQAGVSHV